MAEVQDIWIDGSRVGSHSASFNIRNNLWKVSVNTYK